MILRKIIFRIDIYIMPIFTAVLLAAMYVSYCEMQGFGFFYCEQQTLSKRAQWLLPGQVSGECGWDSQIKLIRYQRLWTLLGCLGWHVLAEIVSWDRACRVVDWGAGSHVYVNSSVLKKRPWLIAEPIGLWRTLLKDGVLVSLLWTG